MCLNMAARHTHRRFSVTPLGEALAPVASAAAAALPALWRTWLHVCGGGLLRGACLGRGILEPFAAKKGSLRPPDVTRRTLASMGSACWPACARLARSLTCRALHNFSKIAPCSDLVATCMKCLPSLLSSMEVSSRSIHRNLSRLSGRTRPMSALSSPSLKGPSSGERPINRTSGPRQARCLVSRMAART